MTWPGGKVLVLVRSWPTKILAPSAGAGVDDSRKLELHKAQMELELELELAEGTTRMRCGRCWARASKWAWRKGRGDVDCLETCKDGQSPRTILRVLRPCAVATWAKIKVPFLSYYGLIASIAISVRLQYYLVPACPNFSRLCSSFFARLYLSHLWEYHPLPNEPSSPPDHQYMKLLFSSELGWYCTCTCMEVRALASIGFAPRISEGSLAKHGPFVSICS